MRILMLGQFPPSPSRIDGGVAAAMTYLCQALVQLPDVDLLGVRLAPGNPSNREDGAFGWPVLDLPLDRFSVSTLFLKQKRDFRAIIERCRPDVVHAQGADAAGLLAVESGVPAVITVHGVLGECATYQPNPLVRARARFSNFLTERPTLRKATDLIAISPYVVHYYGDEIGGRVHAIPNAVAPSFFNVRRAPERGRFVFAGRVSKLKGVLELVQAVAACRDKVRCLVLAGATADLTYESELRRSISRAGLDDRIRFAGLLDEPALIEEFARAEALILPSYQETAPMVVQQAMAAGLPVVATRVGGVPYQIEHDQTGLLVQPGVTDELTQALARFDADRTLGARLGAAARESASMKYEAGAVARATYGVYSNMLNDGVQGRSRDTATA